MVRWIGFFGQSNRQIKTKLFQKKPMFQIVFQNVEKEAFENIRNPLDKRQKQDAFCCSTHPPVPTAVLWWWCFLGMGDRTLQPALSSHELRCPTKFYNFLFVFAASILIFIPLFVYKYTSFWICPRLLRVPWWLKATRPNATWPNTTKSLLNHPPARSTEKTHTHWHAARSQCAPAVCVVLAGGGSRKALRRPRVLWPRRARASRDAKALWRK